jgi:hypothetical protein
VAAFVREFLVCAQRDHMEQDQILCDHPVLNSLIKLVRFGIEFAGLKQLLR